MSVDFLSDLLLWSTIINFGILLWWFFIFIAAHDMIYRLHYRMFKISADSFDLIHYTGIIAYKLFILFFNLIPWIAIQIIQDS